MELKQSGLFLARTLSYEARPLVLLPLSLQGAPLRKGLQDRRLLHAPTLLRGCPAHAHRASCTSRSLCASRPSSRRSTTTAPKSGSRCARPSLLPTHPQSAPHNGHNWSACMDMPREWAAHADLERLQGVRREQEDGDEPVLGRAAPLLPPARALPRPSRFKPLCFLRQSPGCCPSWLATT